MEKQRLNKIGRIKTIYRKGAITKAFRAMRWQLTLAHQLLLLFAPLASYASTTNSEIGSGRALPTAAAVLGLIGVIVGVKVWRHSSKIGGEKARLFIALGLATISLCVGGIHAINSKGGFGTGNGLAGAIIAIGLGVAGIIICTITLFRTRPLPSVDGISPKTGVNKRG